MGKRLLKVSAELFVEFLKARDDRGRTFSVDHALPDDARVDEAVWMDDHTIGITLESATWPGVDRRPLHPSPSVRIHFEPPAEAATAAE